jgi:uncharacterized protein YjiS (DUF1127 family)
VVSSVIGPSNRQPSGEPTSYSDIELAERGMARSACAQTAFDAAFRSALGDLRRWLSSRRKYRPICNELMRLNERELEDIGIRRMDILGAHTQHGQHLPQESPPSAGSYSHRPLRVSENGRSPYRRPLKIEVSRKRKSFSTCALLRSGSDWFVTECLIQELSTGQARQQEDLGVLGQLLRPVVAIDYPIDGRRNCGAQLNL